MSGAGHKRKLNSGQGDGPSTQRTREDIRGCDFTSILPDIQNVVNDNLDNTPQQNQIKKQRSPLHFRDCDNKFTPAEALDRHYEHKTNNTGRQFILAKTFKNDGSQIITCREKKCCYSCKDITKIYTHDRTNHNSKNF